jgi:tRNA (Thr-GGU) A37 N-methylase
VRIVLLVARRVVADPQLDRIDRERVGELVHRGLERERAGRLAGRALKRRGRTSIDGTPVVDLKPVL